MSDNLPDPHRSLWPLTTGVAAAKVVSDPIFLSQKPLSALGFEASLSLATFPTAGSREMAARMLTLSISSYVLLAMSIDPRRISRGMPGDVLGHL